MPNTAPYELGVVRQHVKPLICILLLDRPADRKTDVWEVYGSDQQTRLGTVRWYAHWRRYVFYPAAQTLYDAKCLKVLATFCDNQTLLHKERRKAGG